MNTKTRRRSLGRQRQVKNECVNDETKKQKKLSERERETDTGEEMLIFSIWR